MQLLPALFLFTYCIINMIPYIYFRIFYNSELMTPFTSLKITLIYIYIYIIRENGPL